jgi:citronellyl-CoA dehydrogenase
MSSSRLASRQPSLDRVKVVFVMSEQSKETFFTEEHEMFRQSVRGFVEKEMKPYVDEWEEAGIFPRELYKKMADEDLLGLTYDEKWGGLGLDYWYSVVLIEELVRSDSAGTNMSLMVQTDMATPVIHAVGSDEQKELFLKPAIAGDKIVALGVSEPNAGSDVFSTRTNAVKDGDDLIINGSKTFITNGTRADFLTLLVRTNPDKNAGHGAFSMVTFPTDVKGYSVGRKLKKMGNFASDTAELFFEDCRIPKRYILGQEGMGFYYLMHHFQRERLCAGVSGAAASQYFIEDALKYGRSRKAFGKAISRYQVWAHKFAELSTETEAGRRLSYHACDLFNRGIECTREVSMAKLFCGELANKVADRCLQFHGGWGYMDEYKISRAFRDVRLLTIGGGTSEVMKEIISKLEGYSAS